MKSVVDINPTVRCDDENLVSFISMRDICDGYRNSFNQITVRWKEVKTGFTRFKNGDIGLAKITPCFENRKSVIFNSLSNGVGAGTTELNILRCNLRVLLTKYLFCFVKSEYLISYGIKHFTGAVGQQRFTGSALGLIFIPIPPLSEQIRIAQKVQHILESTNILSQSVVEINSLINTLKYKILDLFFSENSRYKSYSKNLKDLGMLISGRDLTPDGYNSDNNGIPYLTGASNFENDSVIVNRWTSKPIVISYYNDVLITCKGTIGKIAINQIGECHIARQIMAFRCGESLLPEYVKLFLDYRTAELQRASSSLIPGISRAVILNMAIPVPTIQMQHKIVFSLKSMLAQIAKMDS